MPDAGDSPKVRGETLMRANGRKKVVLWLDSRETASILEAARREKTPLATYVRKCAFQAAEISHSKHRRVVKAEDAEGEPGTARKRRRK